MAIKNTETSYGNIAKAFHWSMFLLLLGVVAVGFYMQDMPSGTLEQMRSKMGWYDNHKSFGILILFLVILRLGWRMINRVPEMPDSMSRIEILSARAMHALLYVVMFVQPLSGWLMSSYGGRTVEFFGVELPALVDKNRDMGGFFHGVHEITALLLIAAFALHMFAALFHHYGRKDNVMEKMSFFPKKPD